MPETFKSKFFVVSSVTKDSSEEEEDWSSLSSEDSSSLEEDSEVQTLPHDRKRTRGAVKDDGNTEQKQLDWVAGVGLSNRRGMGVNFLHAEDMTTFTCPAFIELNRFSEGMSIVFVDSKFYAFGCHLEYLDSNFYVWDPNDDAVRSRRKYCKFTLAGELLGQMPFPMVIPYANSTVGSKIFLIPTYQPVLSTAPSPPSCQVLHLPYDQNPVPSAKLLKTPFDESYEAHEEYPTCYSYYVLNNYAFVELGSRRWGVRNRLFCLNLESEEWEDKYIDVDFTNTLRSKYGDWEWRSCISSSCSNGPSIMADIDSGNCDGGVSLITALHSYCIHLNVDLQDKLIFMVKFRRVDFKCKDISLSLIYFKDPVVEPYRKDLVVVPPSFATQSLGSIVDIMDEHGVGYDFDRVWVLPLDSENKLFVIFIGYVDADNVYCLFICKFELSEKQSPNSSAVHVAAASDESRYDCRPLKWGINKDCLGNSGSLYFAFTRFSNYGFSCS